LHPPILLRLFVVTGALETLLVFFICTERAEKISLEVPVVPASGTRGTLQAVPGAVQGTLFW
jgi:hypothetical protein